MGAENIFVIGITHEELTTEERENFIKEKPQKIIHNLWEENKILGYVVLSTCLRVEFYIQVSDDNIKSLIDDICTKLHNNKGIFVKKGWEAIKYLFEVSCGFYSVIKGEDQILAQIKKSHESGLNKNHTTPILNTIFNRAISVGKSFRTESKICHNALSLEAIALKFIKSQVSELQDKKVLILGSGELAKSMVQLLKNQTHITITNRSHGNAKILQDEFGVDIIPFAEKFKILPDEDIIISTTSAPHLIIREEDIKLKDDKKYIFVDLAIPRDIDPKIGEYSNIVLFTLDDIWGIYNQNLENREYLLNEYRYLVDKQLQNLEKWFKYREENNG